MVEITTEYLAIIAIVVNVILVVFIIKHYKSSQKQFQLKSRPWLILDEGEKIVFDNSIDLYLENIGELPAQSIAIHYQYIEYDEGKRIVKEFEKEFVTIGIIVPKQKHHFTLNSFVLDNIITSEEFNVDITVTYNFGKEEKLAKFNYYYNRVLNHREINCTEAT